MKQNDAKTRITSEQIRPEIPNYRLIKRIGSGAFGEVWLAEEVLTRIYRAVKLIRGAGTSKQRVELEGVRPILHLFNLLS